MYKNAQQFTNEGKIITFGVKPASLQLDMAISKQIKSFLIKN